MLKAVIRFPFSGQWLSGFLEDHADVVQAGDEAAAVHLLAAAGAVAEADDARAVLPEAGPQGEELGVEYQRHEAGLAVGVVAPEDGQLAVAPQGDVAFAEQL